MKLIDVNKFQLNLFDSLRSSKMDEVKEFLNDNNISFSISEFDTNDIYVRTVAITFNPFNEKFIASYNKQIKHLSFSELKDFLLNNFKED